jgi:hypothetical protein
MSKDERTFEQGYVDGYRSIRPGAPIAIPPHVDSSSGKSPYDHGHEQGVAAARGKPSA